MSGFLNAQSGFADWMLRTVWILWQKVMKTKTLLTHPLLPEFEERYPSLHIDRWCNVIYLKAHITAMKLTRGELNLSNYSPYKECRMFVQFARQRQGCEGWPQHPGQQIMGATLGLRPSAGPMLRNNGARPRKCAQFLLHCRLGAAEGRSTEAAPSFCCIVCLGPQRGGARKLLPVSVVL